MKTFDEFFMEEKLDAEDREKIKEDDWGVIIKDKDGNITEKAYPMPDAQHVISAARMYPFAKRKYDAKVVAELRRKIIAKAKEYNVPDSRIQSVIDDTPGGKSKHVKEYKESVIYEEFVNECNQIFLEGNKTQYQRTMNRWNYDPTTGTIKTDIPDPRSTTGETMRVKLVVDNTRGPFIRIPRDANGNRLYDQAEIHVPRKVLKSKGWNIDTIMKHEEGHMAAKMNRDQYSDDFDKAQQQIDANKQALMGNAHGNNPEEYVVDKYAAQHSRFGKRGAIKALQRTYNEVAKSSKVSSNQINAMELLTVELRQHKISVNEYYKKQMDLLRDCQETLSVREGNLRALQKALVSECNDPKTVAYCNERIEAANADIARLKTTLENGCKEFDSDNEKFLSDPNTYNMLIDRVNARCKQMKIYDRDAKIKEGQLRVAFLQNNVQESVGPLDDETSGTSEFDESDSYEPDDCYTESFEDMLESIQETYKPYDEYLKLHQYDPKTNTIVINGKRMNAGIIGSNKQRNRMNKFLRENDYNPKDGTIETSIDENGKKKRVEFIIDPNDTGSMRRYQFIDNKTGDIVGKNFDIAMSPKSISKKPGFSNQTKEHETGHGDMYLHPEKYQKQLQDSDAHNRTKKADGYYIGGSSAQVRHAMNPEENVADLYATKNNRYGQGWADSHYRGMIEDERRAMVKDARRRIKDDIDYNLKAYQRLVDKEKKEGKLSENEEFMKNSYKELSELDPHKVANRDVKNSRKMRSFRNEMKSRKEFIDNNLNKNNKESFEETFTPAIQEAYDAITGEEIPIDHAYTMDEMREITLSFTESEKPGKMMKVPAPDSKYVYFASPENYMPEIKLDRPLFVTPYKSIASIFISRDMELQNRIPKGSYNMQYEEWLKFNEKESGRCLKDVHVYVEGYPDLEPYEIKQTGYVHQILTHNWNDNYYRYPWMDASKEWLIVNGNGNVEFDDVTKCEITYHVSGKPGHDNLGPRQDALESFVKHAIKQIHAKYKKDQKDPIGNQNCLLCTWCFEARMRGLDVLPRPVYSPRDDVLDIPGNQIVFGSRQIKLKNYTDLASEITKAGDGCRFYVHVNWKDSKGGHEFILMRIGGKNYVVDPQQGKIESLTKSHNYVSDINYDNSYIVQLSDKKFNRKLFEKWNNSGPLLWDPDKDIPYMLKEGMITEEEAEKELNKPVQEGFFNRKKSEPPEPCELYKQFEDAYNDETFTSIIKTFKNHKSSLLSGWLHKTLGDDDYVTDDMVDGNVVVFLSKQQLNDMDMTDNNYNTIGYGFAYVNNPDEWLSISMTDGKVYYCGDAKALEYSENVVADSFNEFLDSFGDVFKSYLKGKPIQEGVIQNIKNKTSPFEKNLVYHISPEGHLDGQIFKPRVPDYLDKYDPSKTEFEDVETPRVCFSPSIEGCLNAIIVNIGRWKTAEKLRDWYVYIPEKPLKEYKYRTNKQLVDEKKVYDANLTKEIWIEEPVRLKQYGVIRIDSVTDKSRKKAVPTTLGESKKRNVYDFKWHWLVKPKVLKDVPYDYSPLEVCKDMVADLERYKYGIPENGRIVNGSEHDYDTKWKLQSPEEFEKNGGGICYDFVEFEEGYLDAYGIKCKKYFMSTDLPGHDTHTFILVEDGKGGFIYPESSFEKVAGTHEVKSIEEAFKIVANGYWKINDNINKVNEFKYYVWEFTGHPKYGSSIQKCIEYYSKGEPIFESNCLKPKAVQESMYNGEYRQFDINFLQQPQVVEQIKRFKMNDRIWKYNDKEADPKLPSDIFENFAGLVEYVVYGAKDFNEYSKYRKFLFDLTGIDSRCSIGGHDAVGNINQGYILLRCYKVPPRIQINSNTKLYHTSSKQGLTQLQPFFRSQQERKLRMRPKPVLMTETIHPYPRVYFGVGVAISRYADSGIRPDFDGRVYEITDDLSNMECYTDTELGGNAAFVNTTRPINVRDVTEEYMAKLRGGNQQSQQTTPQQTQNTPQQTNPQQTKPVQTTQPAPNPTPQPAQSKETFSSQPIREFVTHFRNR